MNQNFRNKIEYTKSEVASFFIKLNINRKYAVVLLIFIISIVSIFITVTLADPSKGLAAKTMATVGGFVVVSLLLLVVYILSSEIYGISKSPREITQNEKKIRDRLTRPLSLYYTNKVDVENNYQHYFGEVPTTKQIERHREIEGNAQASIGGPSVGFGGRSLSIDKGEVDLHHPNMVRQFLLAAINVGDILFGIENNTIDLTELNYFNEMVSKLDAYISIPEEDSKIAIKKIKQRAAQQSLSRLKFITHNVLIECEFKMKVEKDRCTGIYRHPISDYLENGSLEFIMSFNKDGVVNKLFFRDGDSKSMVVYGHVNGFNEPVASGEERWILELTPIAIF